jgi:hypothetical protein
MYAKYANFGVLEKFVVKWMAELAREGDFVPGEAGGGGARGDVRQVCQVLGVGEVGGDVGAVAGVEGRFRAWGGGCEGGSGGKYAKYARFGVWEKLAYLGAISGEVPADSQFMPMWMPHPALGNSSPHPARAGSA